MDYLACFWHFWFATVQEVLQADWQEAWHSPQPVFAEALMQGFSMVTICFICYFPPNVPTYFFYIIHDPFIPYKVYLNICRISTPKSPAAADSARSEKIASERTNVWDRAENIKKAPRL